MPPQDKAARIATGGGVAADKAAGKGQVEAAMDKVSGRLVRVIVPTDMAAQMATRDVPTDRAAAVRRGEEARQGATVTTGVGGSLR